MVVADFFFLDFLDDFILAFRFLSAFADDAVFEALTFPFNDVLFCLLPALFVAFFFCLDTCTVWRGSQIGTITNK